MPVGKPAETHSSASVPLVIAPRITTNIPAAFAAGAIDLSVSPHVRTGQEVLLILGSSELPAVQITAQGDTATFDAGDVAPGQYRVRLRVDGIESLLVDRSDPKQPKFDPSQQITIT